MIAARSLSAVQQFQACRNAIPPLQTRFASSWFRTSKRSAVPHFQAKMMNATAVTEQAHHSGKCLLGASNTSLSRSLFEDLDNNRDGIVDLHEFENFVFLHGLTFKGRDPIDSDFDKEVGETRKQTLDYARFERMVLDLDARTAW